MSYNVTTSGRKAEALDALRQQASVQRGQLQGAQEQAFIDQGVKDAEQMANDLAGEHDTIGVTVQGGISQSGTSLGIQRSVAMTITRGSAPTDTDASTAASGTAPAPTSTPVLGGTSESAPTASAPTDATAPVTTNAAIAPTGTTPAAPRR